MCDFTPGPWHVTAMHKGIRPSFHSPGENGGFAICEMYADGRDVVANARLIAAAPELLEALHEARRAIGDHYAPNDCYATGPVTGNSFRDLVQCPACSAIAMYDAAIAKARGEA